MQRQYLTRWEKDETMAAESASMAAAQEMMGHPAAEPGHRFRVRVAGTPVQFLAPADIPLLHGMIAAGASAVTVGCRGGGCGICRIRVIGGLYRALPMSRSRISEADEAAGIVLACRIIPQGDLEIEVLPLNAWRKTEPKRGDAAPENPGEN